MFCAFRSNPAIGGFSEGENEDIFPQVCKELVDNAVDSCRGIQKEEVRRVRVMIENEEFIAEPKVKGDSSSKQDVLRITVTDNGCGMEDIEKCVCPFESNKMSSEVRQMAGRYGIGLTLCMLHAQRLVPNSHTTIKSAIPSASSWTSVKCVVDADQDIVNIVDKKHLPKDAGKSGTAICIVVPGGGRARKAWPRLAEYFARFHLSIGIQCSLEVLAPTFSSVPLYIRPAMEYSRLKYREVIPGFQSPDTVNLVSLSENGIKNDFLDVNSTSIIECDKVHSDENTSCSNAIERKIGLSPSWNDNIEEAMFPEIERNYSKVKIFQGQGYRKDEVMERRKQIRRAFSSYLKRDILLHNVAHSSQRIRRDNDSNSYQYDSLAILEVDMVVCKRFDNQNNCNVDYDSEVDLDEDRNKRCETNKLSETNEDISKGKVILIRMVNRIPLLDSNEASACGLVQGILRRLPWHSVGLEISSLINDESLSQDEKNLYAPTYSLCDNSYVKPFLVGPKRHAIYDLKRNKNTICGDNESDIEDEENCDPHANKKRKKRQDTLQPVGLRMGNVYIVAQIIADPSQLPLPTLSKGRLPMNDDAIDKSLKAGVLDCLRSLQKTNPNLILTPNQLKKTELHAMYIPAFAQGIASMINNSTDQSFMNRLVELTKSFSGETKSTSSSMQSYNGGNHDYYSATNKLSGDPTSNYAFEAMLSDDVESRIRNVFVVREEKKRRNYNPEDVHAMEDREKGDVNMVLFPSHKVESPGKVSYDASD